MIAGIGIDLVKIKRIQEAVQKWDKRFLNRVFTPLEQQYCYSRLDPHLHLSGRFAVKEAIFKALGTGWRNRVRWTEIEVFNNPQGKPMVTVTGMVKQYMADLGVTEIHVSISHDTDYAIGQVILVKGTNQSARKRTSARGSLH
jgi:holo-[acyl-carrier protein] synthase